MPSRLQKVGTTYQRAMTTIFHDLMHTLMEYYVDDLLEKSLTRGDHLRVLEKNFKRLEEYKVRLNKKNVSLV